MTARSRLPASGKQAAAMDLDPVHRLLMTNLFYKVSWRKLLDSNLILGLALLASIGGNFAQYKYRPEPKYFATDPTGRIVRIIPVSEPFLTHEAVLQKAQQTAIASFSLDFDDNNLKAKLGALRSRYTRDGYASLMDQYDQSGLIEKIRTRRLVTSAVATGAGVIVNDYLGRDGLYTWEVEMPMALTVTGQNERKQYDFLVKQTIKRVPIVDNPDAAVTQSLRLGGNTKIN